MPSPPQDPLQARRCFEHACELTSTEREAYLAKLQEQAPELAHEVRELMAFDQQDSALDTSIVDGSISLDDLLENPPAIPQHLGSYEIVERIGSGGMATVYRAVEASLRREVALKVLPFTPGNERLASRFRMESQILSQLDHPGIAKVFASGEEELTHSRCFYFAMELIEGRPILEFVRESKLDQAEILRLFLQVCDAVEFAHAHGVIHRDLKSANILVTASGEAKLLDFGVARVSGELLDTTTVETVDGRLVGTVTHMSPEQVSGKGMQVDHRSDLYSLGVLLFESLCGDSPYDLRGHSLASAAQVVLSAQLRRPRSLGVELPADLEAVLARALEAKPEQRYASAAEIAADLRAFLAGQRVAAATNSAFKRLARHLKRRPWAAASALLALIVLPVLVLLAWLAHRYWSHPADIHTTSRGWITLLSSARRPLFQWDFDGPDKVRQAMLIDRPKELGGGRVVALAITNEVDDPELAGQVVFYDASDPGGDAIWSSASLPIQPPEPEYLERPSVRINVSSLWVADFFPDRPGQELAFFQTLDPYSPTVLHIVDTAGTLLYQVWHDGTFNRLHLLQGTQRLLATGLNSEANWESRGHPGHDPLYPLVVLALDLREGHFNHESWLVQGGEQLDPTLAWYRWLGPMQSLELLREGTSSLRSAAGLGEPGATLLWNTDFACPGVGPKHRIELGLMMSSDGELLGRVPSEAFVNAAEQGFAPLPDALMPLDYAALPAPRND